MSWSVLRCSATARHGQPALLKPFRHSATPLRAKRDGGPTTGLRCAASGELRRAADDRVLACIDGIERAAGGRREEAAGTPARLPVCCSSISGSQHRHRRPLRPFVLAGTLVSFVLATGRGTRIVSTSAPIEMTSSQAAVLAGRRASRPRHQAKAIQG